MMKLSKGHLTGIITGLLCVVFAFSMGVLSEKKVFQVFEEKCLTQDGSYYTISTNNMTIPLCKKDGQLIIIK